MDTNHNSCKKKTRFLSAVTKIKKKKKVHNKKCAHYVDMM